VGKEFREPAFVRGIKVPDQREGHPGARFRFRRRF
jgi:hypothetical protein